MRQTLYRMIKYLHCVKENEYYENFIFRKKKDSIQNQHSVEYDKIFLNETQIQKEISSPPLNKDLNQSLAKSLSAWTPS